MKKMLTLFTCIAAFAFAQAQTPQEEARRVILGERKTSDRDRSPNERDIILGDDRRVYDERGTRYPNSTREQRIYEINREYDAKVQSIRNNHYLSSAEKQRMIRQLNNDRARQIQEINNRYGDRRYENRRGKDYDDRYERGNNGKHKGWEKGKGNQKKYRKYDRDERYND
ncbi:MAG TPA: DUF1542 domain-containing protein [Chitinophagaceae bacterium]|nr:DUF1542 domain-containing protein [Chitinophagaceae bacterium]